MDENHGIFFELRKVSLISWMLKLIPVIIRLLTSALIAEIVSYAVKEDIENTLVNGVILLGVEACLFLFSLISETKYQKISSQELHKCKMQLYYKFLSNPLSMLNIQKHGDSIERLNDDFNTLTSRYLVLYPEVMVNVAIVIIYSVYLARRSSLIAFCFWCASVLQVIPPFIVRKYMQVNYDNCREIEARISDYILEGFQGFVTIKMYHLQAWWMDRLKNIHKKYAMIGAKSIYISEAETAMNHLVKGILQYGIYGIIGILILFQKTSLAVGVQSIALSGYFFSAIQTVFLKIPDFSVAKTAEKRISSWYQPSWEQDSVEGSLITFHQVDFRYSDHSVLENISIAIHADHIILLKGKNGIGKSTVFHLIIGLIGADSGMIKTGGMKPECIAEEDFPEKIFYLPQEDTEFTVTASELFEMVVGSRQERCYEVARQFGLSNISLQQVKISDLSGGERKKIFLSLALSLETKILLLDEPTNSLDAVGKAVLHQELRKRRNGTLIITHDDLFDDIAKHIVRLQGKQIYYER